jgi:hypothetical protein
MVQRVKVGLGNPAESADAAVQPELLRPPGQRVVAADTADQDQLAGERALATGQVEGTQDDVEVLVRLVVRHHQHQWRTQSPLLTSSMRSADGRSASRSSTPFCTTSTRSGSAPNSEIRSRREVRDTVITRRARRSADRSTNRR